MLSPPLKKTELLIWRSYVAADRQYAWVDYGILVAASRAVLLNPPDFRSCQRVATPRACLQKRCKRAAGPSHAVYYWTAEDRRARADAEGQQPNITDRVDGPVLPLARPVETANSSCQRLGS